MKIIIKAIVLVCISIVLFSGCTSKSAPYYLEKESSNPKINNIAKAEIGENIYEKSAHMYYNIILKDIPAIGESSGYPFYWLLLGEEVANSTSIDKALPLKSWDELNYKIICNINNVCLVDTGKDNIFTHYAFYPNPKLSDLDKHISYERIPIFMYNSFKYLALYQGRIGDKIKISFREFKDNIARPAFTQDIEYELDLNKNTIIGFKGLRIEVLNATNIDIEYKVIADYK